MVMVGEILTSTNLTKIYFTCSLTSELIILMVGFLSCFFGAHDHSQINDFWIPYWTDQFTSIFLQNARKQLLQRLFRLRLIGNQCRGNGISGVHTYQCSIQTKKSETVVFNVLFTCKSPVFWSISLRILLTIPPHMLTSIFYRFQWIFLFSLHTNWWVWWRSQTKIIYCFINFDESLPNYRYKVFKSIYHGGDLSLYQKEEA